MPQGNFVLSAAIFKTTGYSLLEILTTIYLGADCPSNSRLIQCFMSFLFKSEKNSRPSSPDCSLLIMIKYALCIYGIQLEN